MIQLPVSALIMHNMTKASAAVHKTTPVHAAAVVHTAALHMTKIDADADPCTQRMSLIAAALQHTAALHQSSVVVSHLQGGLQEHLGRR